MNLCDKCAKEFATCKPENVVFGNGVGNDNVVECSGFNGRTCENCYWNECHDGCSKMSCNNESMWDREGE